MDLGLNDKTVFISGSGRGIGLATAESFLREGARVIINARNEVHLAETIEKLPSPHRERISYVAADLLTEEGIDTVCTFLANTVDGLDCFVANLGSGKAYSQEVLDASELRRFYDLNVLGNTGLLQKIYPILRKRDFASVIFVSSIVARESASAPCGYAMAKSAVLTLSKYLSEEWAQDGIRVNCVLPGNVLFPGGRWEELLEQDQEGVSQYIKQNVAMQRFGTPEEIADAIVFLASEKAGFITGADLVIDGGQLRTI